MGLTPKRRAALTVLLGVGLTVAGLALVYVPAALIVGGLVLAAVGLLGIQVDK